MKIPLSEGTPQKADSQPPEGLNSSLVTFCTYDS